MKVIAVMTPPTDAAQTPSGGVARYWAALRGAGLLLTGGVILLTALGLPLGRELIWGVFAGWLPLLLLVAPGLWRNICPMATLGGLAGRLGWARGWRVPGRVQAHAPYLSGALFLLLVPLRTALLDRNDGALAIFMLGMVVLAFAGGLLFVGKGGWCSHLCPLGSVERFYGQRPLWVVRDTHCRPCSGCTGSCYDLQPTTSMVRDLRRGPRALARGRLLFACAMPWICLAFFTQPDLGQLGWSSMALLYGRLLLMAAAGVGIALLLAARSGLDRQEVVLAQVALALNIYYWFVLPALVGGLGLTMLPGAALHLAVAALSAVWLRRAAARRGHDATPRVTLRRARQAVAG